MFRFISVFSVLCCLIATCLSPLYAAHVPDQLLMKRVPVPQARFGTPGKTSQDILKTLPVLSVSSVSHPKSLRLQTLSDPTVELITFSPSTNIEAAEQALKAGIDVAWVQKNFIYHLTETPNDPGFDVQWYLKSSHFEQAWDVTHGSSDILVGVIDSGVNFNHLDLADHMFINPLIVNGQDLDGNIFDQDLRGWDFGSRSEGSNNPMDHIGHGTLVSGIISAVPNNGFGIAGGSYSATILPVRVTDASESISTTSLIHALLFCRIHNVDVINMSLGGIVPAGEEDFAFREAVQTTLDQDIVIVASAGNVTSELGSVNIDEINFLPAAIPGVITVSAANPDTESFDPAVSLFGESVDIMAGGRNIFSTTFSPQSPSTNNVFRFASGTSFSAPVVTGAVALLLHYNPDLSSRDVYEALTKTATDKGPVGRDNFNGYGLLNTFLALAAVDGVPPSLLHMPESVATMGVTLLVSATSTDNFIAENTVVGTLNYRFNASDAFSTVAMSYADETLSGVIPASPDSATWVQYYIQAADLANNTVLSPQDAPTTVHTVMLQDKLSPEATPLQTLSTYITTSQPLRFRLTDQTAVVTDSVGVTLASDTLSQTFTLDDTGLTFEDHILSISESLLTPFQGATELRVGIVAEDPSANALSTTFTFAQSRSFSVLGPHSDEVLNAPNPFNPNQESTDIVFELTQDANVEIQLFSLGLQHVITLDPGDLSAGYHEVTWTGRDQQGDVVPNGVYVFILKATHNNTTIIKRNKIVVLRK